MGDVEQARVACESSRWGDAWRLLSNVDATSLGVDDIDRLATAAYLTGHDEEGFAAWTRAFQICVSEGAVHRAAHFVTKLTQGLGFKGDLARCRGWVERGAHLLEEAGIDCVEQGYLEFGRGYGRLFEAGDVAGAQAHFAQAGKIAARFAHRELSTLARIGEGRMLIYLGDIADGMALLDEAMVSIEAGELSPLATGDAYCTVIDACSELFDLARCRSWTESFTRWCDSQQELVLYRGHCFLHRAEVLGLLGEWAEALAEARRACDRLAVPLLPAAWGGACAIEGDLLRLLGDLNGAEASYRRASEHGRDPQPGLALLRLAQNRADIADATIRRALGEAGDPISRARLLASYIHIVLVGGDTDAARIAEDELTATAGFLGTPLLRAQAAHAAGAVRLAERDAEAALVQLRRAFHEYLGLGVRYEAARTRLLIAEACEALGDHDAAAMEQAAAHAVFESLDRTAAETSTPSRAEPPPDGLSERELEVLVLLARGLSNRAIAHELVISDKTVASHVSHIFTKTGVTSRTAATAYAFNHGLAHG
ncbi:MAG TPA: LuxR C-terminal-related transcriptional regulator [Acidimicrobiales bacterium]